MRHLKLACRTLLKTPFVTAVAVLSLALGIGANAAIFSLFHQMLLRPLPVPRAAELVNLSAPGPKPGSTSCNSTGGCEDVFSYPMFRDLEAGQEVFTAIAAHRVFGTNLGYKGETLNGQGILVSGTYFPVLELQPALGRLIGPSDTAAAGGAPVVVLTHRYWTTRFAGSPSVLGEALIVNGQALTIVGVAPEGFEGTTLGVRPQIFVPITMGTVMPGGFAEQENRRSYWAYLFARLRPGLSIVQAEAALNVRYRAIINDVEAPLQTGMSQQTLARFKSRELGMTPGARGQSSVRERARTPLLLLLGVTGFVLLIACANIANLLLARAAGRATEMAVRLSIGATRRHLVTQLLVESCVLAAVGGIAGVLVARWTLSLLGALLPAAGAATLSYEIDGTMLLFTAALSLGTGVLFGLFPALHGTRPDLAATIKGSAGQPAGSRGAARFRTGLATAQIALSMTLLVSAALFVRSLVNVSRVDLGMDVEHLVMFGVSPRLNGYTPERSMALFERLETELAAIPGVTAVTASTVPLIDNSNWGTSVRVQGFEAGPDTDVQANFNEVGPAYFSTLGVPLLAGREFTPADAGKTAKVAIVNEAFARKFDMGRDVVGTRMSDDGREGELDTEIIGVVPDTKYSDVKQEPPPLFFMPYRQDADIGFMIFYVRSALDSEPLLSAIPPVVARLDPDLPVEDLKTLPQQVRENVFLDRMIGTLSAAFALLATLLAAVGLYGVLAYTVAQRTREIGLRMALGADRGVVRRMVLGQVGVMTLVGGAIGLAGAVGIGRLASSLLFEVEGTDPVALAVAVVVLGGVALAAGFVPADRASRVDPMAALRYE